jgi:hypothetical protein
MKAINFRPKVESAQLKEIAKQYHYADLSGFINDAIDEKIRSIHQSPRDEKLVGAIKKAVYEYNGLRFSKPSLKEARAIKSKAAAMRLGKEKSVSLSMVIKKLEKLG